MRSSPHSLHAAKRASNHNQQPTTDNKMSRQELCRLCDGRSDHIKIFDEEEKREGLPDKIKFTLNITVSVLDSKKTLCSFCKTKVTEFFEFKKRCGDVEAKQLSPSVVVKKEPEEADSATPYLYPWIPLGNPIPLSDLPPSLDLLKVQVKKENDCDGDNPSPEEIKKDTISESLEVKKENLEEVDKSIDEIINQVQTESEHSDSGEDSKKSSESAEAKSDENTVKENGNMSSGDESSTSRSTHGGRGRKRRGGSVRGMVSKRGRSLRSGSSPKTPANQVKRLTRSSTGTCPRRRVIVSSDESDGDFHDPDDPDDPEFRSSTDVKVGSKSRSSSSSSSASEAGEKETNTNKKKIIKRADLSRLLASAKQEKEEALKKQCPHCKMVYKHWVSYDEHVANCKGPSEKDLKNKNPPEDDDKVRKCVICLTTFKGTRALREHMEVHQPKKVPNHHCKICNENFPSKGGLICHNALKHRAGVSEPIMAPERKKHHCVLCNETFDSSGDYICHTVLKHKRK
ncbi:Zinc finger protein 521 [Frankliniella fusca]|uniref:Zinc finger protein 521 n=1 Tax=Frankliniella fusca TaxID=407009 RepID=A0AAE1HB74_9NEOP|nr:Zinc finger protein 521 [Frankliniella fusca]